MPTEQCVFLILYIHSIYGIILLYMYITKYGCVFLKLGESIYVAMDLIPILFWVRSRSPICIDVRPARPARPYHARLLHVGQKAI